MMVHYACCYVAGTAGLKKTHPLTPSHSLENPQQRRGQQKKSGLETALTREISVNIVPQQIFVDPDKSNGTHGSLGERIYKTVSQQNDETYCLLTVISLVLVLEGNDDRGGF